MIFTLKEEEEYHPYCSRLLLPRIRHRWRHQANEGYNIQTRYAPNLYSSLISAKYVCEWPQSATQPECLRGTHLPSSKKICTFIALSFVASTGPLHPSSRHPRSLLYFPRNWLPIPLDVYTHQSDIKLATSTPKKSQEDSPVAPPPVDRPERGSDASTSIFRESFASRDAVQGEKEERQEPSLERSDTMASVQFLLAHQPSR